MSWEFPVTALQVEVAALMAASGVSSLAAVPHYVGGKYLATNQRAPYFVWVPTRGRARQPTVARTVEEHRTVLAARHYIDVHCAGRTYDQAAALAQNLIKAAKDAARVDIQVETMRWVDAGGAYNQDGETLVVELELGAPFIDAWVDVSTLADPAVATVDPDAMITELYSSATGATDGELALTITYEEP